MRSRFSPGSCRPGHTPSAGRGTTRRGAVVREVDDTWLSSRPRPSSRPPVHPSRCEPCRRTPRHLRDRAPECSPLFAEITSEVLADDHSGRPSVGYRAESPRPEGDRAVRREPRRKVRWASPSSCVGSTRTWPPGASTPSPIGGDVTSSSPPGCPHPPPPAPADDLDDSELDAADRELGLEDDAAAARTRAATTTPDARHGVRGAPPPPARPNGTRPPTGPGAAPAPTLLAAAPQTPPPRTPPPGTPPFSRRPPISGPAHPGGPATGPTTPGDPGAARGPRAASPTSPPPPPVRPADGPRRVAPAGASGARSPPPRTDPPPATSAPAAPGEAAPAVTPPASETTDRPTTERDRPEAGARPARPVTGSLADALAPATPGSADGDPAETPAGTVSSGHGPPGETPGAREPASPAQPAVETVSSGHGSQSGGV